MKKRAVQALTILLAIFIGLNLSYASDIFATKDTMVSKTQDEGSQVVGELKEKKMLPKTAKASTKEAFTRDISTYAELESLKAWMNGSLVYEKGKTPKFPNSIYEGMSFKVALNWKLASSLPMPLADGDYFTLHLGKISNLSFEPEKKETLYIDRIAVGSSYLRYAGDEITYTIVFNNNITYFNNIKGNASANVVFKNITVGDKVDMEFGTEGSGQIIVVEKPAPVDPSGNVGIGIPNIKPIKKELITIGKSTYSEDMNIGVIGWRIAFSDLLHENQRDLSTIKNSVYEDVIIEDTLDENQTFVEEVEYGYGAPFFLDIPLLLPGTQNAVAYTGSDLEERVSQVDAIGNGNSDYIIKPAKFTKLESEAAVRATPLSWTLVEVNNRQKLVVNLGNVGTTDETAGITSDMIDVRYPERNPKPYSDLDRVIDTELLKYEDVLQHKSSPYYTIQKQFAAFKRLYDPSITQFVAYETAFNNYLASNREDVEPAHNPPAIPTDLQLASIVNEAAYKDFDKAIGEYQTTMGKYVVKMSDGNAYKETLKEIIQGLKDAKIYYQAQGNRLYGVCLKYKTQIVNGSSGVVHNEAKITTGKLEYNADAEAKHTYDAGISGVFMKGDVVIVKADASYHYSDADLATDDDVQGMANVKFEVYNAATNKKIYFFNSSLTENGAYRYHGETAGGDDFTSVVETDRHGKIILSGLAPNKNYYLREVSTLDGYYRNQNQTIAFTVDTTKVKYKLIENVARSITLKKVDKNAEVDGNASALSNATFALYTKNDVPIDRFKKEVIDGVTYFTYTNQASDHDLLQTQGDGTLHIKNLPAGNFYIKESVAPSGYILADEKHPFTLEQNYNGTASTIDLGTIYNLKEDASLSLEKVDKDTSQPLKDVAFELYQNQGGSSWDDGNHADWTLIEGSQFNQAGSFVTSQKIIGNAIYTDEDGKISLSSIPKGDYYVKEVKAADGYERTAQHFHFKIEQTTKQSALYTAQGDDERVMVKLNQNIIENKLGKGSFKIVKYDQAQGGSAMVDGVMKELDELFYENDKTILQVHKPLANVSFDVYHQTGTTINLEQDTLIASDVRTDENGQIKITDVNMGTYYFIEKEALEGYELNQNPVVFNITHEDVQTNSKTLVRLVENQKKGYNVILQKKDADTGKLLQGAEFTLCDKDQVPFSFTYNKGKGYYELDQNGIQTLVSNASGQIILHNMQANTSYTFREMKAPMGYQVNKENEYTFLIPTSRDEQDPVKITITNKKIKTITPDPKPIVKPNPMPTIKPTPKAKDEVKTGDTTNTTPLILMFVVAIVGMGVLIYKKRKSK